MALFRVEALARCGALEEARRSFAVFAIAGRSALDPELLESLETVLRGDIPDADLLARLRGRAETQLADRLRRVSCPPGEDLSSPEYQKGPPRGASLQR